MLYHQKSKKARCPCCIQSITEYLVYNVTTKTESLKFNFADLLKQGEGNNDQEKEFSTFECLDH
jgi:hypothetical protein